jgi:hypothetical protein
MRILAVAPPVVFWSAGSTIVTQFVFKNDAVAWLGANFNGSESYLQGWAAVESAKSKILHGQDGNSAEVVDSYESSMWNQLTHSYYIYLQAVWDNLRPHLP